MHTIKQQTKVSRRRIFAQALLAYQDSHGFKREQMADLFHVQYNSLGRWMDAKCIPSDRELRRLCNMMNMSYRLLFSRDALVDSMIAAKFMSFDALQQYCHDLLSRRPYSSWELVSVTAGLVYNYFNSRGFQPMFEVAANFGASFRFADAGLVDLRIKLDVNRALGLCLTPTLGSATPTDAISVSDDSLAQLADQLTVINHEYNTRPRSRKTPSSDSTTGECVGQGGRPSSPIS